MQVLDNIPFDLDLDAILNRTHVEPGTEDAEALREIVDRARAEAKPKALFRECFIEAKGQDTVTLGGVTFRSRTLRKNLDRAHRVFAFVATCGKEVERIELLEGDFLQQFWMDTIKSTLLGTSRSYLMSYLDRRFALGKVAVMAPGSGDVTVWPIQQQRELFALLGDVDGLIGVRLTDSFLMLPDKSVSGICFPTELDFRSCQLCHRENCPSRGAPFDPDLWESIDPESQ